MDLYLPEREQPDYPVVIVVYGSAWYGNNLKGVDYPSLGKALLYSGFAVAMPNHQSSKDAIFPAQINDIKAVVRFLRANAASFQIDTSFVGITGSSSGGHLSALAGTTGGVGTYSPGTETADLEGAVGQCSGYSSSVDAVVDWFGPTHFLLMDSCGSQMNHDSPNSPESGLIGGAIQDHKERCALANPVTYVDEADPPFLIIHGDNDPLVPHCQSEILYNALQQKGIRSEFILVPGGQHGLGVHTDEYINKMVQFFREIARNKQTKGIGMISGKHNNNL